MLATLVVCAACTSGGQRVDLRIAGATATSQVTTSVATASDFRVLPGHLSARAKLGSDLGRMDPNAHLEGMSLVFAPHGSRAQREALLAALQNPGSPLYHRWLTPEDYATRFGARDGDLQRAIRWLEGQGFEVAGPSRPRTRVTFSGSVDQLERAFRTEMHRYQVRGESHFALAVEPSVPAELADAVTGLRNVHDFHPRPLSRPAPAWRTGQGYQLAPADWASIYGVAPLYAEPTPLDGTGQKIAVVGASALLASDIETFRSMFGLPAAQPDVILVPSTGPSTQGVSGFLQEASLDVEWAGAIARNATIEYVTVGENRNSSVDDAALYAFENAIAPIVTFGYASCEAAYTNVDASNFSWEGELASMLGITFVAASGDGAAAACDEGADLAQFGLSVAMPAAIPGALAIGGTTLLASARSFDGSGIALGYLPEKAWNDTGTTDSIVGGTGGASTLYGKPVWQLGVTPDDGARDVPDLSFSASGESLPYVVIADGQTAGYGGTSCGAPSFAGVLAILNQAIGAPQPGLGNVGPLLYALARSSSAAAAFHDVTIGGNVVPCQPASPDCPATAPYEYGFAAAPGYDQATGNGSVNAAALVQAWSALHPTGTMLAASLSGATEGATLTLSAAVSSPSAGTALTGNVIFYAASQASLSGLLSVYPLGTVPVTATISGGAAGATAQLVTFAPPGFAGTSSIVAFYSGDSSYLASWSKSATVDVASTFAVSPASTVVPEEGTVAFTFVGGEAPVTWSLWQDDSTGTVDPSTGVYKAGTTAGRDIVVARDAYGAEALATVDVDKPDSGAPPMAPAGNTWPVDDAGDPDASGFEPAGPADAATRSNPANAAAPLRVEDATGSSCSTATAGAPGFSLVTVAWPLLVFAAIRGRGRSSCRTFANARRPAPRPAR